MLIPFLGILQMNHVFSIFFTACPMHFSCENGGTCENGNCTCPSGFGGFKCEKCKVPTILPCLLYISSSYWVIYILYSLILFTSQQMWEIGSQSRKQKHQKNLSHIARVWAERWCLYYLKRTRTILQQLPLIQIHPALSMAIFVSVFKLQTPTVNGLGSEQRPHLIQEIGFGRVQSRMVAMETSCAHRPGGVTKSGMIQNATTKLTLYVEN